MALFLIAERGETKSKKTEIKVEVLCDKHTSIDLLGCALITVLMDLYRFEHKQRWEMKGNM